MKFFRNEQPDPEQVLVAEAYEIAAWCDMPYYSKYMAWLDREIDKPLPLGQELEPAVVRQNTLKEVRARLRLLASRAASIIQDSREEQSNAVEAP